MFCRILFVPKDAKAFLAWAISWANVYIWSSARLFRVSKYVQTCFGKLSDYLSGWAGQQLCDVATFCLEGGKPVFFKCLENFRQVVMRYEEENMLLIDNSTYKCHFNRLGSFIIVPNIQDRPSDYLSRVLKEFLTKWRDATDRPYVVARSFKNAPSTKEDRKVKAALDQGASKTTYLEYVDRPPPAPFKYRHH